MREKYQSTHLGDILAWKKRKNLIQTKIKIRQTEMTEFLMEEWEKLKNQAVYKNLLRFMERRLRDAKKW